MNRAKTMQSFLKELIDLAAKATGSDTQLATALLVSKTVVNCLQARHQTTCLLHER
jgi:ribosomal protein L17